MLIVTMLLLSALGGSNPDLPQIVPRGATIQHQQDGTTWVVKLRGFDRMTVVDLRGADDLAKQRYFAEFGSGLYDALILGAGTKSACTNLVDCAKRVKDACVFGGSTAKKAKLAAGNCEGECKNGTQVQVICAP